LDRRITDLIELARLDTRIGELNEFNDKLPGLRTALADERQAAEDDIEAEREKLESAKKNLRKKEAELVDGEEKLKQIQGKLNQVKTNKEYDAALAEIAKQKGLNGGIESDIIVLFDEVEEAEKMRLELEAGWQEKIDGIDARR